MPVPAARRLRRSWPRLQPNEETDCHMTAAKSDHRTLGWIGTGLMGFALASRLLEHGCDLSVYNRTRAKSEPLASKGARLVDRAGDLSDRDIVLTSVAG